MGSLDTHKPYYSLFLSFTCTHTHTLIKQTMMHGPLHCQLTGEVGLLRACYNSYFPFFHKGKDQHFENLPSKRSATVLHHLVSVTSNYVVPSKGEVKSTNKSSGNLHPQRCFPEVLLLIPLRQNSLSQLSFCLFLLHERIITCCCFPQHECLSPVESFTQAGVQQPPKYTVCKAH